MLKNDISTQELSSLAKNMGADVFGIADLRPARQYVSEQGGDSLGVFSHAVVVGIRLLNSVVDNLDPYLPADFSLYGWHVYKSVSPMVDQIALQLSRILANRGFNSLPIPPSQFRRPGERCAIFSHKLAANLAGVGWIGKNCLLITPEFGPRIRLASVLTDCELESGNRLSGRCGDCEICVNAFPVGALKGIEFNESDNVEKRINVNVCGSFRDGENAAARRGAHVCALCLASCPKLLNA
jgi:epoxyqueuosine reductase QueG